MNLRQFERRIIVGSRFFTVMAVVGSLAGSLLMFALGLYNIFEAYWSGLAVHEEDVGQFGTNAVISVIEGLDRFLIAIVLLYFAYGVYSLFIHPGESEHKLAIPDWLQVKQIGQLKQVVAEVIIVVLFVLFLRATLEAFRGPDATMTWLQIASLALLPVSTVLLALALRLVELHPKTPLTSPTNGDAGKDTGQADGPTDASPEKPAAPRRASRTTRATR